MTTLAELHKRESYHLLDKSLGEKQLSVLLTIARSGDGLSNSDIAKTLNIPINRVTGRTNELCKLGVVGEAGRKFDESTGRNVTIWNLTKGFIDFLRSRRI